MRPELTPDWRRPPEPVLGAPVAIRFLLARSTKAAVKIQHVAAYPSGFVFQLDAVYLGGWGRDPMFALGGWRRGQGEIEHRLSREHLQLSVQFADGSYADNLGEESYIPLPQAPSTPILERFEGEAHERSVHASFWVCPLPSPGDLVFQCEWPRFGIPLTRHRIDAGPILDAATRATDEWSSASLLVRTLRRVRRQDRWGGQRDLNPRPPGPQPGTLTS